MWLGIGIVAGVFALVGSVLTVVFTLVARAQRAKFAQWRAALESEGIVRDSGPRHTVVRYRNYRRPGFSAGANIHTSTRQLVLTREHFVVLGSRIERCPLAEVNRFQIAVDGNTLRLVTDRPIDATGHMDLRVRLDDAADWARALREHGATEVPAA